MKAPTKEELKDQIFELQKEIVRLETSLSLNERALESLEKRCSDQHEQIMRLQDALVAREAPDAYADRREEENQPELSANEEAEAKRAQQLAVINKKLLDGITQDHYFNDAQDMMEILTRGAAPVFERLHPNDES